MLTVVHTITVSVLCQGGYLKHCEEEETEQLSDSQISRRWRRLKVAD